ncbi:MAG TPA: LEA type 2 family protein [Chitinophagaceae bacterium]|nr:LEA type 2 family protein [Chitinophagaceae bacterium]MCB9055131.1 LEA type 2 family protein [Chitinophagales bacterium]HPG10109.1 LEA type 2 family protein [Chitinophagaceae bacterium]
MKLIFSTLIVASLLLTSCKAYKNVLEPEFRDVQNIEIIDLGLTQSKAGADIVYYNPNKFNATLSSAKGDVYVDDKYMGRFELADKVYVKKKKEFVVPVILKLDNISILKHQKEILKKKEVMIRVNGLARITKTGFVKEVPIKYEKMESVDRLKNIATQ